MTVIERIVYCKRLRIGIKWFDKTISNKFINVRKLLQFTIRYNNDELEDNWTDLSYDVVSLHSIDWIEGSIPIDKIYPTSVDMIQIDCGTGDNVHYIRRKQECKYNPVPNK